MGFVTSIGPHSILGWGLSIRSGGECGRGPFNIFTFFPCDLQAQWLIARRVSCQLASDLCALCPNHLLRGERSCLSYYNSLYAHLCHGKGDLPWCGLLVSVARHCSLSRLFAICVPCHYCQVKRTSLCLYAFTMCGRYNVGMYSKKENGALLKQALGSYLNSIWMDTIYTDAVC